MAVGKPKKDESTGQAEWKEPDRSDNTKAINILNQNKYTFCKDAYFGSGGFRTGYYLVPNQIETMYPERRQLAAYNNYVKPIVDATVNPVFAKPIKRIMKATAGNSLYQAFIDNCDGNGNNLDTFMANVAKLANLNGVEFIVVDSRPYTGTVEETIRDRAFPYVYSVSADLIVDYSTDPEDRFIMVECEQVTINKVMYRAAIKWTDESSTKMIYKGKDWEQYEVPYEHGLGVIPVIPVYSTPQSGEFLVEPAMFDICRTNWFVYNLDSERREVYRKQGFSMLAIQTDMNGGEVSIRVGTGNVLFVPKDVSNMPQYVSPNPAIASGILEESKEAVARLYQLAEQNGVTAVKSQVSGVAKEWDFQAHGFILSRTASMCQSAEYKIANIFGLYTGKQVDIIIEYPLSFEPRSKQYDLDMLDKVFVANISPTANKVISLAMVKVLFPDLPEEQYKKIEQELEKVTPPTDGGLIDDSETSGDKV